MKTLSLLTLLVVQSLFATAQQELRIHHINVGDGDATLIGIYDIAAKVYTKTMLIDGGSATASSRILPYLKKVLDKSVPKLDYVALTHYHSDHYKGLLALAEGSFRADSVIDQGGYDMSLIFPSQHLLVSDDQKPSAMAVYAGWTDALKLAVSKGYVKGHVTSLFHYGEGSKTNLGNNIVLGSIQGQEVVLECVAGWGNTLGTGSIVPNPSPGKDSPNNFTLAFVLRFGQFRYFIGGDLGGDASSSYIDQETPLSSYFASRYTSSWSWNHISQVSGHICGFKADHHGSSYSNTKSFMTAMSPAICVISAGKQSSWKLPRPRVLEDFSKTKPLSFWTSSSGNTYSQGLYVTNLFDFQGYPSKTTAIEYFAGKPGVSFSYGNAQEETASSYMISVAAGEIMQKSQFQVYRIDDSGAKKKLLANFFCHTL